MMLQTEKSMRKSDSEKVQTLEAALQEAHAELKAEKLLLNQVCLQDQHCINSVRCAAHRAGHTLAFR